MNSKHSSTLTVHTASIYVWSANRFAATEISIKRTHTHCISIYLCITKVYVMLCGFYFMWKSAFISIFKPKEKFEMNYGKMEWQLFRSDKSKFDFKHSIFCLGFKCNINKLIEY